MARKPKVAADTAVAEATRLAGLLADAAAPGDDPLAPPALIRDPRLAAALAVWRDLAPLLVERNLLGRLDRMLFAQLCYWQAEFVTAVDDILARGYSVLVTTVSGDRMPRLNPSVKRRDTAVAQLVDLAHRFGLTPLDRHTLFRAQKGSDYSDLFDQLAPKAEPAAEDAPAPDTWAGLLDQQRPN